jgi:D-alanyl-D-alanine dipeptidase
MATFHVGRRIVSGFILLGALSCVHPSAFVGERAEARQLIVDGKRDEKPRDVSDQWKRLIGEYLSGSDTVNVFERDGSLQLMAGSELVYSLRDEGNDRYVITPPRSAGDSVCGFRRNPDGAAAACVLRGSLFKHVLFNAGSGGSFRIKPLKRAEVLRREALRARPPREAGHFLKSDLVELTKLDPTIHLDIRYATSNNFVGEKFYSQSRAFLQRPAAEALVRAHQALRRLGYGLLIHDAYRPWYVTKMFWDATPNEQKMFVANPAQGSRHNRGCAVDLSLYNLKTGKEVEMVSGYDEFSHRAYPDYPGGTSLQRWHRQLLRKAMEAEGFKVFEWEWWHFDYKDWRRYPIGTVTFEAIR